MPLRLGRDYVNDLISSRLLPGEYYSLWPQGISDTLSLHRFAFSLYSNLENLVLRARSETAGSAGKDSDLFWSTGVLEKAKTRIST